MLGEWPDTSNRFCDLAKASLKRYYEQLGLSLADENFLLLPLKSEGKISDRVNVLHAALLSMDKAKLQRLSSADLVLIAAHSQGSIVAGLLLQRMLQNKLVGSRPAQQLCLLTMAGVHHGPFPTLRTHIMHRLVEIASTQELFELNENDSIVSRNYHAALNDFLNRGGKMVCVGSWADEVVPVSS